MAIKVDVVKDEYCLLFQYDTWWMCYEKVEWIGLLQALVATLAVLGAAYFIKRQITHASLEARRTRLVQALDMTRSGADLLRDLKKLTARAVKAFHENRPGPYFANEFVEEDWGLLLDQIALVDLTSLGAGKDTLTAQRARQLGERALDELLEHRHRISVKHLTTPEGGWYVPSLQALQTRIASASDGFDALLQARTEELQGIDGKIAAVH